MILLHYNKIIISSLTSYFISSYATTFLLLRIRNFSYCAFWDKWWKKLKTKPTFSNPPTLITIDHHRDFARPEELEQKELLEVEKYNDSELALFCWTRMNALNDGHILSAAFLNTIGDIILLKNKSRFNDNKESFYLDYFGNKHCIYEFIDVNRFESFIISYKAQNIIFDIDLDYFISEYGNYMESKGYEVMCDKEIVNIINPARPYMKIIYKHLEGFTIATEPKHCGGIVNSSKILIAIQNNLFSDGLNWK